MLRSHSAIGQTAPPIAVEIAHPESKGHRMVFLRRLVIMIDETKMVKPCPPRAWQYEFLSIERQLLLSKNNFCMWWQFTLFHY